MQPLAVARVPNEASDEAGLITALLVRFPQIATIVSHPANGTLVLSFAVRGTFKPGLERELRDSVGDHVRALLAVRREEHDALAISCERDDVLGFVRVTRDARTFSREELLLLVALLSDRFGEALVQSPPPGDEMPEDEGSVDDLVDYAIEALREPVQQKSVVGFREEKRVLVYFVPSRKKAKARSRA